MLSALISILDKMKPYTKKEIERGVLLIIKNYGYEHHLVLVNRGDLAETPSYMGKYGYALQKIVKIKKQ